MNSATPTTAPFFFSMSPKALIDPRPQSVLTARKSTFLTPSLSTSRSSPSASISEGGLMRKIHGLPRLVMDAALQVSTTIGKPYSSSLGIAASVRPAIATRRRVTNTTDRLPIESLLRDRDMPARIAHDLTGGKRVYSRGLDGDGREILRRGGEAAGRSSIPPGRGALHRRRGAAGHAARGVRPLAPRPRGRAEHPHRRRRRRAGRDARIHVRRSRAVD